MIFISSDMLRLWFALHAEGKLIAVGIADVKIANAIRIIARLGGDFRLRDLNSA